MMLKNGALLLDTHVVLWLHQAPQRIPPQTLEILSDDRVLRLVSAVTGYEILNKHRLGKLPEATDFVDRWEKTIDLLAATELPLTVSQSRLAGRLSWDHRDPWDRMLAAQAMELGVPLVTADPVFTNVTEIDVFWR